MNIVDDSGFTTPSAKKSFRNRSADHSTMVKVFWDIDTVPVPAVLKDILGLKSNITKALNKYDGNLQLDSNFLCFGLDTSISRELSKVLIDNGFQVKLCKKRFSYCTSCKEKMQNIPATTQRKQLREIPRISDKPELCEIVMTNRVLQHVLSIESHSSSLPPPSLSTASSSTLPTQHILIVSGDHHFAKIHQKLRLRKINSFLAVRDDSKIIVEVEEAEERRRIWLWGSLSTGDEALEPVGKEIEVIT